MSESSKSPIMLFSLNLEIFSKFCEQTNGFITCIIFKLKPMKIQEQNKVHNERIVADYKSQISKSQFINHIL